MTLSNEILQVCFDIHEKRKTPLEGQEEILRLCNVSKFINCDHDVRNFKDRQECEKCGRVWIRQ